ncbi:hypothetical protein HPB51_029683 [Rhipicephalus microplus]|uniref:Uncharacterized protein n=1 Tax=Rhipicephalus microplus TaxID=6941 RepID=A0A9J6CTI9_RHIMP|nr:hypothetical protein HPB51_029683 [Rhipicephalus microplus]
MLERSRAKANRTFVKTNLVDSKLHFDEPPPLSPVLLRSPPGLNASASNAWQPGLGMFTGDASGAKYKLEPAANTIGHGTASAMRCSQMIFFQRGGGGALCSGSCIDVIAKTRSSLFHEAGAVIMVLRTLTFETALKIVLITSVLLDSFFL